MIDPRGKPLTDLDFFYLQGARLVAGEAKANGRIEQSEARTLAEIGKRMTIDEIVFATTRDTWNPAARDAVAQSFPAWRPTARLVTSAELLLEP